MKKWEYRTVCSKLARFKNLNEFFNEVNQLGKQGWRIVPIPLENAGEFLLEREVPEETIQPTKEWDTLVLDLTGNASNERENIRLKTARDSKLVAVVSLPRCRRAYFRRRKTDLP